ncbi:hypothetical protein ACFLX5_03445 [Chloroflexota bacterium]
MNIICIAHFTSVLPAIAGGVASYVRGSDLACYPSSLPSRVAFCPEQHAHQISPLSDQLG